MQRPCRPGSKRGRIGREAACLLAVRGRGGVRHTRIRMYLPDSFADGVQLLPQARRSLQPGPARDRNRDHSAPMLPVTGSTMPVM